MNRKPDNALNGAAADAQNNRTAWTEEERSRFRSQRFITAKIMSFENGMTELEYVRAVRIISKTFTLLVMDDFMPLLGSVKGEVTFVRDDYERSFKNVNGFFCHRNNEFTLLLQED